MNKYLLSIIIPTHNRAASLIRTLTALNNQSINSSQFEVIIVADGCTDETVLLAQQFKSGFSQSIVEQSGQGAAIARNNGVRKANGKIINFLDDDIEVCQDFVSHRLDAHDKNPGSVVIGASIPTTQGQSSYLRMSMRSWWFTQFSEMEKPYHRFTFRDFMTGNISMEKSDFDDLKGFDESFVFIETFKGACSCEDWELGVRAIKKGLQFIYCPGSYGYHHEHESTDIKRFFKRATQEGRGETLIGERHPEILGSLQMATIEAANLKYFLPLKLALYQSKVIDFLMGMLTGLLPLFEYFRLRRGWRNTCGWIRLYWYWKGVTEKLSTYEIVLQFISKKELTNPNETNWLSINLIDDIKNIEKQIDIQRPDALTFNYGELGLGSIKPRMGAEKLRSVHLKKLVEDLLSNSPFADLLIDLEN